MTAATAAVGAARTNWFTRGRVLGIAYLAVAVLILIVFGGVLGEDTKFGLNFGPKPAFPLPDIIVPSQATIWLMAGVCAFLGVVQLVRAGTRWWAIILALVAIAFITAFITWAAAGKSMSLVGLFSQTLQRSVPITFGALSGLMCERSGVVNIGIEGMLLTGAFTGAVAGSVAQNVWVGLAAAIIVGGLLGLLLAVLAIRYLVDQIIAGTVINIFAAGITAFLSARVLMEMPDLNNPPRFQPDKIPGLGDIPIIGPILFTNSFFVFAMFVLILVIHLALFHTRYGLRVRAVGEHPIAAETVGINVVRTRYINVLLGGMIAGFGGAYFTLGSTGSFDENMTAGKGFIGLAAMIFGGWTPIGAFLASLVFGFADALQNRLSILNAGIPSEILLMLPYIVTIIVVAGLVGRVRAPAADGKPFKRE
ncbi:MAG: ABC transporter permease [Chloroflexi bacterium]|nr:ABC transporter permease [Chloroflexota bacterium]